VAGEGEQLAGQLGAALGCALYGVDQARGVNGTARTALQQIDIAENDGQQIVEVVGDTAGQLANSLQTLRLLQHRLGLLTFADFGFERARVPSSILCSRRSFN
jgi:hypothetical protein